MYRDCNKDQRNLYLKSHLLALLLICKRECKNIFAYPLYSMILYIKTLILRMEWKGAKTDFLVKNYHSLYFSKIWPSVFSRTEITCC